MKRCAAILLIALLLLPVFAPFAYADYEVGDGSYAETESDYALRQEVVAAFVHAANMNTDQADTEILKQFHDAGKIASTCVREVAAAVEAGLVSGYEDGNFRPKERMSRVEALVILNRMLFRRTLPVQGDLTFVDTPKWADADINRLAAAGVVRGYGNGFLGAGDDLTWQQAELLTERAARMTGPCGNYYEYVNEKWLSETQIPEGYSAWSDVYAIDQKIMKEIGEIIYSLYRRHVRDGEVFAKGSSEQKLVDVFMAAGNTVYRDKLGLQPVQPYLKAIDAAADQKELLAVMADLERAGFHGFLPLSVSRDIYDSAKNVLTFSEVYTGMNPDLIQSKDADRIAAAYKTYVAALFSLYGEENAASRAEKVTALCRNLAENSLSLEEHNRIQKNYMVFDKEMLRTVFSAIDVETYLEKLGFHGAETVVVYDLPLAGAVNEIFGKEELALLKDYLRASVMDGAALYLNSDAFSLWQDYQNALNQTEAKAYPADYAVQMTEDLLGWDLAKLYTERYASAEDKAAVEELTREILKTYQKRIQKNNWMSSSSKQTALRKLEQMQIRVGYPENAESYTDPELKIDSIAEGGNLIEYRSRYCKRYYEEAAKNLNTPVSDAAREKWTMLPQTVNAMYEPSTNSITIPAGMLRAPFYEKRAVRERNLGGIGSVIAHEISHAFDAIGSQFDENGNMRDWWQKQDREAFTQICARTAAAYDAIEVLPGETVNGKATLSENLADIAAMACILDVAGDGNPKLEELFYGYATIWRSKATKTYQNRMLKTDTHAPDEVRVNRVLSNFPEFIDYYRVKEGDGMYLSPKDRLRIWNREF